MWNNLGDNINNLIEEWKPKKKYSTESGYRDDLSAFLRRELNQTSPFGFNNSKARIVHEDGRNLCDIGINNEIGIELKKDFKKISQADRLIGQVTRYLEQYDEIFIVMVGKTNPNTLDHLQHYIDSMENPAPFGFNQTPKITIIDRGEMGYLNSNDDEDNNDDDNDDQGFTPSFGLFGNKQPLFKF